MIDEERRESCCKEKAGSACEGQEAQRKAKETVGTWWRKALVKGT